MKINKNTPFWNRALSDDERIEWLLGEMTVDEKLTCLSSQAPDIERLGIPGFALGGEAAHGVEARNDQNDLGKAEVTTSFPQPSGMSATWDTELIQKAGEVTGKEARVIYHRHPDRGLSRWAPTVDIERDPRWGRNEEGYGEDPVLTGAMAGAYIRGMQGNDQYYIRTAATLKHFYGNNTKNGRGWKSSSIDPRNKYELYLEPFRRCIEDAGAAGVMTAYNKINGTVGLFNKEVQEILKDKYGLMHAVSDGGAMELVAKSNHYYGFNAESIASSIKAGVDAMSDAPDEVRKAAEEAYALGLLSEKDMDKALKNVFRLKLHLGIYDRECANPFDNVTEADIDSVTSREICREISREGIVLLKNDKHILPIDCDKAGSIAVIGPLADVWFQDWYGGKAPYYKTLRQGIEDITGMDVSVADGFDRVVFRYGEKGITVNADGTLGISSTPDVFIKENWGEGSFAFKCVRTGKYMNTRMPDDSSRRAVIAAEKEDTFDWFVLEIFHMEEDKYGHVILLNRFHYPLYISEEGGVFAMDREEGTPFTMEIVEDGLKKALETAINKNTVILALGNNPMINAKEEIDRTTMRLPEVQENLITEIGRNNPYTILVLFANYPYAVNSAAEKIPAVLLSATGSQDLGTAMAETIFGINAPAGRLNMTWYNSEEDIPEIDDYDIIKGKRTYRYFDGKVLYPFGFGLTYTQFEYSDMKVISDDELFIDISFTVTNTGECPSDEVAEIYAAAPPSRVKKPLRQLIGFRRLKNILPGESRMTEVRVRTDELRFYDVISRTLMTEDGIYHFFAGRSCMDERISADLHIAGMHTGCRDVNRMTAADHYDDYENVRLTEGHFGFTSVTLRNTERPGRVIYNDCVINKDNRIFTMIIKSENGGGAEVYINGIRCCDWTGDTVKCEQHSASKPDRYASDETKEKNRERTPKYEKFELELSDEYAPDDNPAALEIVLTGDIELCSFYFESTTADNKAKPGVAN